MKLAKVKTRCIVSESNFYIREKVYELYKDEAGLFYTKGEDGLYDKEGRTVSKFKRLKDEGSKQKSKRSKISAVD